MAGRKSLLKATHKKHVKSGAVGGKKESKRKKAILDAVKRSSASVKATLQELGLTQSTYYRWLKLYKAKGLDGLETGSPVSDELWQRFADFEKTEGKLIDERELSIEETQTMKREEDKDKIRKPLDEKPAKEPEKAAAPETEGPPRAAEPKTVREPRGPADSTIKYVIGGIGALALVIAFILLASWSNSTKFYLKQNDQMVEFWQGRFAPMGERLVASFSEPKILEAVPEQDVFTKKQAFGILSDYFVMRANEILNTGEPPDLERVRSYLTHACNYGRCKFE
jgi:transposase-like protein